MASRTGAFALIALVGLYSGYSWYGWLYGSQWAIGGGIALVVAGIVLAVFTALKNPRTCDFLIDMDGELRKVIWPETKPPFDPKAEAWGATYVVIITVVVLTAYIYVVDLILGHLIQDGLFKLLYS